MKIILVCLENYQEYIYYNIKNLKLFDNNDITILTNRKLADFFISFKTEVIVIDDLYDYGFSKKINNMDSNFRNGFWKYTNMRFFYIYSYLKMYNIKNCIHLENDVISYVCFDELLPYFKEKKIYTTFDSMDRVIPGIVYIPDHNALKPIIDNYDFNLNDMYNLGRFNENIIEPLPIITKISSIPDKFCKNYINCIYDGAALGQYLGGIDKRNQDSIFDDTRGFINETCVVNYSLYKYFWIKINGLYVPHILIDGKLIRIINLHIHSKELLKFQADQPLETKYITFLEI